MSDNQPETGTSAGVMPTEPASQPAVQPTGETPEALREQLAKMQAALKEANKEAAARRKRLEELEAAEQQRQEASKTAEQKLAEQLKKLEAERDAAEQRARQTLIRAEVTAAASRMQFRDPSDVLKMIDASALEIGDDGSIKGLDEQLQALAKAKPYLLATSIGSLSPTMPGHGQAQGETDDGRRARLFGGGESVIGRRGGIVWPQK